MRGSFAKLLLSVIFATTLAADVCPAAFAEEEPDKVVLFAESDPQMNAAVSKARSSLQEFWDRLSSPAANEDGFSLKIAIGENSATEHFWCNDIVGDAMKATCAIANDPQVVKSVSFGQRIVVEPDRISDWMYRLSGKIKGGETIRVMLPKLSRDEAEYYRALLADE